MILHKMQAYFAKKTKVNSSGGLAKRPPLIATGNSGAVGLRDVGFPRIRVFVFEREAGEGHVAYLVQLEGPVGSFDHAEFSGVFRDLELAVHFQVDVREADTADLSYAVAPQL